MLRGACESCGQQDRLGWASAPDGFRCGACHDQYDGASQDAPAAMKAERMAALNPVLKREPSDEHVDLASSRSRSRSMDSELPVQVTPRAPRARNRGRVTGAETVGPWPATDAALAALSAAKREGIIVDVHLVADQATQKRYKARSPNAPARAREMTLTLHCGTRNLHVQNAPSEVRDFLVAERAGAAGRRGAA